MGTLHNNYFMQTDNILQNMPNNTYTSYISPNALPVKYSEEKPWFFVHCHVPKTGGTSFNTILEKNFGGSYDPFQGRFIHLFPKVTCTQFEQYIKIHDSITATSSHQFTVVLPYRNKIRNIIALGFIRDPVKQFFSKYFHQRRYGMKCPERDFLIDDYIQYKIETCTFFNYSKYLTQIQTIEGLQYLRELIKFENLFLFPLEQFDVALYFLKIKFPGHFCDISYKRMNISPKDQEVTENMKKKVAELIPQENYAVHQLAIDCLENHLKKKNIKKI